MSIFWMKFWCGSGYLDLYYKIRYFLESKDQDPNFLHRFGFLGPKPKLISVSGYRKHHAIRAENATHAVPVNCLFLATNYRLSTTRPEQNRESLQCWIWLHYFMHLLYRYRSYWVNCTGNTVPSYRSWKKGQCYYLNYISVLWNRNYLLRFRFRFRFWLLKSFGSGSGSNFGKLWFRFRFQFLLLKKLRFRFRFRFQLHI